MKVRLHFLIRSWIRHCTDGHYTMQGMTQRDKGGWGWSVREGVASLELVLEQWEIFATFVFISFLSIRQGLVVHGMYVCTVHCKMQTFSHSSCLCCHTCLCLSFSPMGICVFHASVDGGG